MAIIDEATQLVKEKLGEGFHELTIERLVIGLFFTGVKLSNGQGGVCYTPIKTIPDAVCCPTSAGRTFDPVRIGNMKAGDILLRLSPHEPVKTAVAIATLNALSASCWAEGQKVAYEIKVNVDAQDVVRMPKDSTVAVVGALVPALRVLKSRGGTWWVVEEDPRTLKESELDHFVPAAESADVISKADTLIVTGATLVTQTLESILQAAKPHAEIAVMGPTAGLLPEPLFKRGVRVVGGVWVKNPDKLLDVLAAGGSGYHFFDTLADRIVIERP